MTIEALRAKANARLNKLSEQPPPLKKGSTAAIAAKERFGHFPGVTEGYPVAAADREVNEYLLHPDMLPSLVNTFCACVAQVERDVTRGDLPTFGPAEVNAFILPPLAVMLEAAMNCYNHIVAGAPAVVAASKPPPPSPSSSPSPSPSSKTREELEKQQEQLLHALWVQIIPKLSALVCGCLLGDVPDTHPTIRRLVARAALLINSMDVAIKTQQQQQSGAGASSLFINNNNNSNKEQIKSTLLIQEDMIALLSMVVDWDSLSGQIPLGFADYNNNNKRTGGVSELVTSKPSNSSISATTTTTNVMSAATDNNNTSNNNSLNAPSNTSFLPPPPCSSNFYHTKSAFSAVSAQAVPQSKCIAEALQALRDVLSPLNPQSAPACLLPYSRAVQCLLFNLFVYPRLYRFCYENSYSKSDDDEEEQIINKNDVVESGTSIKSSSLPSPPTPQIHSIVVLSFLRPLLVQWGSSSSSSSSVSSENNTSSSSPSSSTLWCTPLAVAKVLCCSALVAPSAENPRVTTPNTSCAGIRTLLKVSDFSAIVQKALLWLIANLLQIHPDDGQEKNNNNNTPSSSSAKNSRNSPPQQSNQNNSNNAEKCKTLTIGLEMDLIVSGTNLNPGNFVVLDDDMPSTPATTSNSTSSSTAASGQQQQQPPSTTSVNTALSTTPSPTIPPNGNANNTNNTSSFSQSNNNNINNSSGNTAPAPKQHHHHVDPLSSIQQVQVSPDMALSIRHCQNWCELFLEIIDGTRTFPTATDEILTITSTIKRRLMWVLGNVAVQCAKIIAARTARNPVAVCLAHTCFVGTCEKFVAGVFALCPPHLDAEIILAQNNHHQSALTFREITTSILNDVHDCFFSSPSSGSTFPQTNSYYNDSSNNNNSLSPIASPTLNKSSINPSSTQQQNVFASSNNNNNNNNATSFILSSTTQQDQNTNCVTTCLDEMLASLLTASIVLTYAPPQSMSAVLSPSSPNNNSNSNTNNILTQLAASFGISWPVIPVAEETRLYLGAPPPNLIQILVLNSKQQQHKIFSSMIDWLDSHLTSFVVPLINPSNYYYSSDASSSSATSPPPPPPSSENIFPPATAITSASFFSTSGNLLDAVSSKILLRAVCEGCLSAVLGPHRRRVNPITLANTVWTCLVRATTSLASRRVTFLGAEAISSILNLSLSVYGGRHDKNIEEHLINALVKYLEKNCASLLSPASSTSASSSSQLQNITHQHLTLLRLLNRLFSGIDGAPSIAEQPRHYHHHHHHHHQQQHENQQQLVQNTTTTTVLLPTAMSKLIRILVHTYTPNLLGTLLPSNDLRNQNQQLSSPEFRNMTSAILALCWEWHFIPSLAASAASSSLSSLTTSTTTISSSFQQQQQRLYSSVFDNIKRICADRPIESRSPADWQHLCSYLTTVVADAAQYVECEAAVRCCGLALEQLCRIAAASESVMVSSYLAASFRVIMDEYAMLSRNEVRGNSSSSSSSSSNNNNNKLSTRIMYQNIMRFIVGACSAIVVKHLPLYNPSLANNNNTNTNNTNNTNNSSSSSSSSSLRPEIIACRTYCALSTLLTCAAYRCGATTTSNNNDDEDEDSNSVVASCFTTLLEVARFCRREIIQGTYRYHRIGSVDVLALMTVTAATSSSSSSSKPVLSPLTPPWHTSAEDETDDDDEDDDEEKENNHSVAQQQVNNATDPSSPAISNNTSNINKDQHQQKLAGENSSATAVGGDGDTASVRFEKRVRSFAKLLCKLCLTSLVLPNSPRPQSSSSSLTTNNDSTSNNNNNTNNSIALWDKRNSRSIGLQLLSQSVASSLLRFVSVDDIGSFEWNVSPYFATNNNHHQHSNHYHVVGKPNTATNNNPSSVTLKLKCIQDAKGTKISNLFANLEKEMLTVRGDAELMNNNNNKNGNTQQRHHQNHHSDDSGNETPSPLSRESSHLKVTNNNNNALVISPMLPPAAKTVTIINNNTVVAEIKATDPVVKTFDAAHDAEVEAETRREKLPADGRVIAAEHFAPLLLDALGCLLPAEPQHRRMAPWAGAALKVMANGLEQRDGSYFEQLRTEIASHRNKYHLNIVVYHNSSSSSSSTSSDNNSDTNRKNAIANKLFHDLIDTPKMSGVATNEYYDGVEIDNDDSGGTSENNNNNKKKNLNQKHGVRRTATDEFHCHLFFSSSSAEPSEINALEYSFTSYFNANNNTKTSGNNNINNPNRGTTTTTTTTVDDSSKRPPSSNTNNTASAAIVVCIVDSVKDMYNAALYYDTMMTSRNASKIAAGNNNNNNHSKSQQQQQQLPAILFVVPTATQDYEQYFNHHHHHHHASSSFSAESKNTTGDNKNNIKQKKPKVNPLDTSSSSSDEDDFFSQQQNQQESSSPQQQKQNHVGANHHQELLAGSSTFVIHVKRVNPAGGSSPSASSSSSNNALAALSLSSLIYPFFDGAPVRGTARVAAMLRACVLLPSPFAVENYRERRRALNDTTAAALQRMRTMMSVMKTLSGGGALARNANSPKGGSSSAAFSRGAIGGDYQSSLVEMTPLIAATTQLRTSVDVVGEGQRRPFHFDDDDSDRHSNESEDEEMRRHRKELEMSI